MSLLPPPPSSPYSRIHLSSFQCLDRFLLLLLLLSRLSGVFFSPRCFCQAHALHRLYLLQRDAHLQPIYIKHRSIPGIRECAPIRCLGRPVRIRELFNSREVDPLWNESKMGISRKQSCGKVVTDCFILQLESNYRQLIKDFRDAFPMDC